MCYLGDLYYEYYKNYDEAKKYYLMALDHNNVHALCGLGCIYTHKYTQHEEAKKYF